MNMIGMKLQNNIKIFSNIFYLVAIFLIYKLGVFNAASLSFIGILLFFSIYKPNRIIIVFFLYLPFYYILKDLSGYMDFIGKFNQNFMYLVKDFILIFLVLALIVRIKQYKNKIKAFLLNKYIFLYLLFIFSLIITSLIHFHGVSTVVGLRSYLFASLFIFFVYFININFKNINFIFKYTMIVSTIFAFVAIYQYYIDEAFLWDFFVNSKYASSSLLEVEEGVANYRTISLIGHPNNLGLFLAMGSIISFVYMFDSRHKLSYFSYFLINIIGLLTTGTRMSLLSLLVGILFYLHYRFKRRNKIRIVFLIFFITTIITILYSGFGDRFSNINIITNPRINTWITIFLELKNPFILMFGQGIGHHLESVGLKTIDSSLIEMLREGGVFVLVIFTTFIYKILFSKVVNSYYLKHILLLRGVSIVLLMQMLTNSFLTSLFGYYLWFCFGILIVLLSSRKNKIV
jgi:hypothetical protein